MRTRFLIQGSLLTIIVMGVWMVFVDVIVFESAVQDDLTYDTTLSVRPKPKQSQQTYRRGWENATKCVFIDGGANRGNTIIDVISDKFRFFTKYTPLIGKPVDIYLFEASPIWTYALLDICSTFKQIKGCYYDTAISTKTANVTFRISNYDHEASSLQKRHLHNTSFTEVAVQAIDFCEWLVHNADITTDDYVIFKLDIEGSEYELIPYIYNYQHGKCIEILDELYVEWHRWGRTRSQREMKWEEIHALWYSKYREKGVLVRPWH